MQSEFVFSSESVTRGHPDKVCDQISDKIVAAFLKKDPGAQVVAEAAMSTGIVFTSVRFASRFGVDSSACARAGAYRTALVISLATSGAAAPSDAISQSAAGSGREPNILRVAGISWISNVSTMPPPTERGIYGLGADLCESKMLWRSERVLKACKSCAAVKVIKDIERAWAESP